MRKTLITRVSVLALAVATTAVACAGGGGGSSSPSSPGVPAPPPPPPAPPPSIPSATSAEYRADWGIDDSKAITAWQDGITGKGVTIAVIDSGVDGSNPEMTGRLSSASTDIDSSRNLLFQTDTHGSEVAAIAAANFNNSSTVGIAFDATILAIRADDGSGSFPGNFVVASINYATNYAVTNNVPTIINLSLGFSGTLGSPMSDPMAAAIQNATSHGVIVVNAAGNDGTPTTPATEPEGPGNVASTMSVSNGLVVIAGAHDRNDNFASFSNEAGSQAAWYLTAPGVNVVVPDFGAPGPTNGMQLCGAAGGVATGNCLVAGTSYSSPAVAAALALLREAFPGMTPAQVVQLLLSSTDTTDSMGNPLPTSTWGHGRLDIAKAFQSFGPVQAPLTQSGTDVTLTGPMGVAGAPFGDGFVRQRDLWQAVGFDSFGRSFPVNLANGWSLAPRTMLNSPTPLLWGQTGSPGQFVAVVGTETKFGLSTLEQRADTADYAPATFRVETRVSPRLTVAFASNAPALLPVTPAEVDGFMAFAGATTSSAITDRLNRHLSLSFTTQSSNAQLGGIFGDSERHGYETRLSAAYGGMLSALTIGRVAEQNATLGLAWSNRIGATPDGATQFIGASSMWQLNSRWRVGAEFQIGETRVDSNGWLTLEKPIITTAFSASASFDYEPDLVARLFDDSFGRLTFDVRQPLRVEDGTFSVSLPQGNAYGRSSLTFVTRSFDPSPSGRELDYELGYELWSGSRFAARAAVLVETEPGHIRSADSYVVGSLGMRMRF
ncbi:MAG: S8 family peptidase [Alphaproteobacteria bacterium]